MELSIGELQAAVGGRLQWAGMPPIDGPVTTINAVKTDSREIAAGDVFWALQGRVHHGAEFAQEALLRGAVGVVTDRPIAAMPGSFCLHVENAQLALWELAAWHRQHFSGAIIAVTGSVGKTTAREMIHTVLCTCARGTASPRNFNNQIGVPLSVLRMAPADDYAVLELGASATGEIDALARLCEPDIAVVTNCADAHLGGFGSLEQVGAAKCELLRSMADGATAVLNGDDAVLRSMAGGFDCEKLWFGRAADNCLMATHVESTQGQLRFRVAGQPYFVPVWGRHHLCSSLAAVALGRLYGRSHAEIADALAQYRPVPMRCEVTQLGRFTVINDTYNSCPYAMKAALALLRDFGNSGRRIVVNGDMQELGAASDRLHYQLGQEIVTHCGADRLVACGQFAEQVADGAMDAGMPENHIVSFAKPLAATQWLRQVLAAGDVLLVKGSRKLEMDRLIVELSGEIQLQVA